jgi:hypothetical protein
VAGARSIDELAEWGARASGELLRALGVKRHPLRWRRTPSSATLGRVLGAVDGDALAIRDQPERALPILGITNTPDTHGT